MKKSDKLWLLLGVSVAAICSLLFVPPVAQVQSFHQFADQRSFWQIPNFANVVSNLPFLLVGVTGLVLMSRTRIPRAVFPAWLILFAGVILTGLGSAWYHHDPDNDTLVWDRIPMTIVFMSLTAATLAEWVNLRLGSGLLVPLVMLGVGSVLWWHYTELHGHGDLRLYGFVQYYPMLLIALVLVLFYNPANKTSLQSLGWVVGWYLIAKLLEHFDKEIFVITGVSGHSLKHLAAAVSTWYLVILFRKKYAEGVVGRQAWRDKTRLGKI